ncbi:hypothetical protein HGM15179_017816 [Zosterops borbonicus]|uniref:Uncharacterized protein n=1 Tax=Zosterops borbonicus TaxID=364589 RepID=A0A8K1G078_9PASS|nr:hypothetical protein HGM15179_017816 [Zosterops borbonicus]
MGTGRITQNSLEMPIDRARKCYELAAKTALEEHTCNKWLSACWQDSVPNIPKADCRQETPYLEDEHGKGKKLYSLSALFAWQAEAKYGKVLSKLEITMEQPASGQERKAYG